MKTKFLINLCYTCYYDKCDYNMINNYDHNNVSIVSDLM